MAQREKPGNPTPDTPGKPGRGGKTPPRHETTAEQLRESAESTSARDAEASIRDRMVDIGRANKQAGRQKKS